MWSPIIGCMGGRTSGWVGGYGSVAVLRYGTVLCSPLVLQRTSTAVHERTQYPLALGSATVSNGERYGRGCSRIVS